MALPIYNHIPNLKGLTKIFFKLSRQKGILCGGVTVLNPTFVQGYKKKDFFIQEYIQYVKTEIQSCEKSAFTNVYRIEPNTVKAKETETNFYLTNISIQMEEYLTGKDPLKTWC